MSGDPIEPDLPVTDLPDPDLPGPPASDVSPAEAVVIATEALTIGRTPDVRADDPWAEAGRKILRFHLAKMLARVPGVIAGEDPEEVHAMRVAARRMRAAWRVFGDGFERDARRRYRGELRDIGARLGAVRDLDVLIEILVAYGGSAAPPARRRRAAARRVAGRTGCAPGRPVAVLESERFAAFVLDYETFAQTPGLAALALAAARAGARAEPHAGDDLGGLPGRLGVRWRPRGGRPRHASRAPDRRQVAALHARVRPRAARTGGDGAHQAGRRDAGPPRPPARPPCRCGAGPAFATSGTLTAAQASVDREVRRPSRPWRRAPARDVRIHLATASPPRLPARPGPGDRAALSRRTYDGRRRSRVDERGRCSFPARASRALDARRPGRPHLRAVVAVA